MNLHSKEKVFKDQKVYLHTVRSSQERVNRTIELIRQFGGQIEQFLDHEVNYVITDVPKEEWPQNDMLQNALKLKVRRLISLGDLLDWCFQYIASQSNSDEDDDPHLKPPFLRFEDMRSYFAPTFKEFQFWPEIRSHQLPLGKSVFSDPSSPHIPSSLPTTPLNIAQRGVKRKGVYCEICNIKINVRIEDHVNTQAHKANTEKMNWAEVSSVIESLPSLSTLNMRRITNLTPPNGVEHQEFLCLHKVESVSQLFSNKDLFAA